ncbi:MAG: DUF58 domain-containing protein [Planctomycetota bacterium]|nr:DUF58 domain-containing protein [Planctomycetota bacterium]
MPSSPDKSDAVADNTPAKGSETSIRKTLESALKTVEPSGLAKKSFVVSAINRLQSEKMTPLGFSILSLFSITTILSMAPHLAEMHWFAVVLFFILIIPAFAPVPRVTTRRELSTRSKAGSTLDYQVQVKNNSRWRHIYDLVIHEVELPATLTPAYPKDMRESEEHNLDGGHDIAAARVIEVLAPGEELAVPLAIHLPTRGFYRLDRLRAETIFPFGIWRRGKFHKDVVDDILVLPNFTPLEHLDLPISMRHQPGGMALTSNLGESPEFLGIRDYREGDNPRDIDWRSWARTGKPAVKEYHEEYFCRVALVLDTQLQKGHPEKDNQFEAAVSIAAAVADQLAKQETVIDIFAAGPSLYRLQAGRNLAFVENILEVLACLEGTEEYPFQLIIPELMDEISQIASVVFVLLDWDEHRARFVQTVTDLGAAVKVILIRDQACTDPIVGAETITGRPTVQLTVQDVENGPSSL